MIIKKNAKIRPEESCPNLTQGSQEFSTIQNETELNVLKEGGDDVENSKSKVQFDEVDEFLMKIGPDWTLAEKHG